MPKDLKEIIKIMCWENTQLLKKKYYTEDGTQPQEKNAGADISITSKYCVVVPVKNPNGHNYTLGSPILVARPGMENCLRVDGSTGNCMATSAKDSRIPTEEEFNSFFDRLGLHDLEGHCPKLIALVKTAMKIKLLDDAPEVHTKECGNCKAPIYKNEKRRQVDGLWYHTGCVNKGDLGLEAIAEILSKHINWGKLDDGAVTDLVHKKVLEFMPRPFIIEVKSPDGKINQISHPHHQLKTLLYIIQKRKHVYLWGGPGSGKSTATQQVATAMGLPFGYISLNPQTPDSRLLGFIDASGVYRETVFAKIYKNGGVFCIDEMDNASAGLLTTLNSLLENGHGAFPDGIHPRHPDFILVAAGNTAGKGASLAFPDRMPFDAAFAERFIYMNWEYDEVMERQVALAINSDAVEWVDFIQSLRKYCKETHPEIIVTPRATFHGASFLLDGVLDTKEIAEAVIFKGLDPDTVKAVLKAVNLPKNKKWEKVAVRKEMEKEEVAA